MKHINFFSILCIVSMHVGSIYTMEQFPSDQKILNDDLVIAVRCGDEEQVRTLLQQRADVNALDDFGYSPLHHAVQRTAGLVELLVLSGANLNVQHETKGFTPLHLAIWSGNRSTALALVQSGASLTVPDAQGVAPLKQKSRVGIFEEQHNELLQACLTVVPMREIRKKYIEKIVTRAYIHLGQDGVNRDHLTAMVIENMITVLRKERDKSKIRLKKPASCRQMCGHFLWKLWYRFENYAKINLHLPDKI